MLNALIVDDEELARRGLEIRLQDHDDITIVGTIDDPSNNDSMTFDPGGNNVDLQGIVGGTQSVAALTISSHTEPSFDLLVLIEQEPSRVLQAHDFLTVDTFKRFRVDML